jgi:hypothetical protein
VAFETTATRIWKHLAAEDRLEAAQALLREPAPDAFAAALGAVIRARRLRPQVARTMPAEQQARILSSGLDPGEPLAASLLIALHLSARRPLLVAFLDALGLPHEDGVLKEEADALPPPATDKLRDAVRGLEAAFPAGQVRAYLNTLLLQDPERWSGLAEVEPGA